MKNAPLKEVDFYLFVVPLLFLLYAITAGHWHLWLIHHYWHERFAMKLIRTIAAYGTFWQFAIMATYVLIVIFFFLGIRPFYEWKKKQRAIDCLALKSGVGTTPTLLSINADGPYRTKLKLRSEGVGLDRYESKKGDLESAFGAVVEGIRHAGNPKFVEISLAKRRMPETCKYHDLLPRLDLKYGLIIGESLGGLLTRSILKLPHLLIAGTTGGGKSVFFKQALLGLAQTSPYFQMFLLDLKGGVEMKEFGDLPNVSVAKDEATAVSVLNQVQAEMMRRYEYLESKGYKFVEFERDKLDMLLVGVDEASVLYTKPSGRSKESAMIEEARRLTDDLAKRGRAAGIHLVLATQKVTKETIDTKVQENIGGRMCFQMNTLQGSMTVLGNKMAYDLPHHPGRAIWAEGRDFIEVQAPMISEEEIQAELEAIKEEFSAGKRKCFQALLIAKATPKAEMAVLSKPSASASEVAA